MLSNPKAPLINWVSFKVKSIRIELGFDLEDWSLPLSINFLWQHNIEIHLLCFYVQLSYERIVR